MIERCLRIKVFSQYVFLQQLGRDVTTVRRHELAENMLSSSALLSSDMLASRNILYHLIITDSSGDDYRLSRTQRDVEIN